MRNDRSKHGPEKPCAYEPCGKIFRPRIEKGVEQNYCCQRCSSRGQAIAHPDARTRAVQTKRAKEAKRKAEAAALGVHPDQLLDAKLERYWAKVADPDYYTETRMYGFRSALQDLG